MTERLARHEQLAFEVRRTRRARGETQAQLAERAGLGASTVHRIETAQAVEPLSYIKVMDALDLDREDESFVEDEPVSRDSDDDALELGVDLVRHWLEDMGPTERSIAVRRLTRFIVLSNGE